MRRLLFANFTNFLETKIDSASLLRDWVVMNNDCSSVLYCSAPDDFFLFEVLTTFQLGDGCSLFHYEKTGKRI